VPKSVLFALIFAALAVQAASEPVDYEIRKGQTLSRVALVKLGSWNDSILAQIRADNPGLDPDRIEPGQKIRLRIPSEDPLKPSDPVHAVQVASRKAVVTMVRGHGEILRASGAREPLLANRFLSAGDGVQTEAGSYAELVIDNQSVLRLNEKTRISLLAIQAPQQVSVAEKRPFYTRIALLSGRSWAKVQKWAGRMVNYQIQLPTAIAGVHGTVFESQANDDSSGAVSVHEGEVGVGSLPPTKRKSLAPAPVDGPKEISKGEWMRIVRAGQRVDIPKTGAPEPPHEFKVSLDDPWVEMNRERDSLGE
jgi:hypothetical protein